MSELLVTAFVGALEWVMTKAADIGLSEVHKRFQERQTKEELVAIGSRCVEAAIVVAPEFGEELRSDVFVRHLFAPAILKALADRTSALHAGLFVESYIETFVAGPESDHQSDDVLRRVYRSDRQRLETAFSAFFTTLRQELWQSVHWKDDIRDSSIEEIRSGVSELLSRVSAVSNHTSASPAAARQQTQTASEGLLHWVGRIEGAQIVRPEFERLLGIIRGRPNGTTLVVGEAGSGKSSLFAALLHRLQQDGVAVVGIKADQIPPDVRSLADLSRSLGMSMAIDDAISTLSRAAPVVLLIDQLDAVSEVMDRSSERMRLLLQLVHRFSERPDGTRPPVHALVSSRPFEADHDARFKSLKAESIQLELPPFEAVTRLLAEIDLDQVTVPEGLQETLRRPFALRLFVDLVQRGAAIDDLLPGALLERWLQSANLGDIHERPTVYGFLQRLASDMTESEMLWRPADAYDFAHAHSVRLSEAAGLVIRNAGRIGFSHQSWLDDFQAKSFQTAEALVEHVLVRQDGLFVRATVLRSLERLRRLDGKVYDQAIDMLLGSSGVRRHILHLIVDLIASQSQPRLREVAWVRRIVRDDEPLGRRALLGLVKRWRGWREGLRPELAQLMRQPGLLHAALQVLIAEVSEEPNAVLALVDQEWGSSGFDLAALELFWRAGMWGPKISGRLARIFAEHQINDWVISDYIEKLAASPNPADAAELVGLYLTQTARESHRGLSIHGIGKAVARAPDAFARVLLPWFLEVCLRDVEEPHHLVIQYPRSRSLPWDWKDRDEDAVFDALRKALIATAENDADAVLDILEPAVNVDISQVQELIADALATGVPRTVRFALDFLLADERNLVLGDDYLIDENNTGYHVAGLSSRDLICAISPYLGSAALEHLRNAIEGIRHYRPKENMKHDAATRFRRIKWTEEVRFPLLEGLPDSALSPRRRRQVLEWRARQPVFLGRRHQRVMASSVGSPMSHLEMQAATDAAVVKLLNEVHDGSGERWSRRTISRSGGVHQVAQAFAELAKLEPSRAMSMIHRDFQPGVHEHVAGSAVRELAGVEAVEPASVIELIHALSGRGFTSEPWRHGAAWALQKLADRASGLDDRTLELLEGWIVDDEAVAADRIARRAHLDEVNKEQKQRRRDDQKQSEVRPVLFVRMGGGTVLPDGNYPVLAAMFAGLVHRPTPDCRAYLAALERHLKRFEDPWIWSVVLAFKRWAIFQNEPGPVQVFLNALTERYPEALSNVLVGRALWAYRDRVPSGIWQTLVAGWMQGDAELQQAAGELVAAAALVNEEAWAPALMESMRQGGQHTCLLGLVFGAAIVWAECEGEARLRAHEVLRQFWSTDRPDFAQAVTKAISRSASLSPDAQTVEFLKALSDNTQLLASAARRDLYKKLQELLLHPGFDEIVLETSEKAVDLLVAKSGSNSGAFESSELVSITITLQRNQGPVRARAMDLYERLLDANVYGAADAAEAALKRASRVPDTDHASP